MTGQSEPAIQLTLTLYEFDPIVKELESNLPTHSEAYSIRRTEVEHYSAGGGSHWMSVITTTITASGIKWLFTRLSEMFGLPIRIDVTENSCSVTARSTEELDQTKDIALQLMVGMRSLSESKRPESKKRGRPTKKKKRES